MTQPSIGRTVHYRGPGTHAVSTPGYFDSLTYPAVVVGVHEDGRNALVETFDCDLFVMTKVGHMNLSNIPYSETPKPGHWSWPMGRA